MKKKIFNLVLIASFIFNYSTYCQNSVKDYLSVSEPITFDSLQYNLSWSSHPSDKYYKHEYLPVGENSEKFNHMLLIDFIEGDFKPKDAVDLKVSDLKQLKTINPLVNYNLYQSKDLDEYILDFLVSKNTPNGENLSIVERNVYKHIKVADATGRKGILIFGVSTRAYDNDCINFLKSLKQNKTVMIHAVSIFKIPPIKILN